MARRCSESHGHQANGPSNGSTLMCTAASNFLLDIIIISSQQLHLSSLWPTKADGEAVQVALIQISQIQEAWFFHPRLSKACRSVAVEVCEWLTLPSSIGLHRGSVHAVIWLPRFSRHYLWPLTDSIRKVKLELRPTPNLPLHKNSKLKRRLA